MSSRARIAERLTRAGLVKHAPPGEPFNLKSGKTSDIYVDLRTLGHHPHLRREVIRALADAVPSLQKALLKGSEGYLAGLPLGGIETAALLSDHMEIPFLLIRKEAKDHGTGRLVEAEISGPTQVLLIDDVMTTGSTVRETVERFKEAALPIEVVGVLCVVNRCDGVPSLVPETEIPIYSLLTLDDLRRTSIREPFDSRIAKALNTNTRQLFEWMFLKRTNVCWSADVDTADELLTIFAQIAPHIALIKVHFDAVSGLDPTDIGRLFHIAYENKVMVMGDRKFADIGSTVRKQLQHHPACSDDISVTMHCCTVHALSGPGPISELARRKISSVLVAQMSNEGSITDDDYSAKAALMAKTHPADVMGLVCQSRSECDAGDGFVYMTPGVHLERTTDGKDQRYRDCRMAIGVQRNDVVIVGRGISMAEDPLEAAKRYQSAAWAAYRTTE